MRQPAVSRGRGAYISETSLAMCRTAVRLLFSILRGCCWGADRSGRGGRRCIRSWRQDTHRNAREAEAASGVVDDVDLADVGSGLEVSEWNIELEGDRAALRLVEACCRYDGRFIDFHAAREQLHAGEYAHRAFLAAAQAGRGGRSRRVLLARRIIDLIKQIQVLILAEDVCDVGHPLHTIAVEWIRGALVLGGWALTGENDRAQLDRRLLHVGHIDQGLEAAHGSGLVLAHDKLQLIAARCEGEASRILDVLAFHLLRLVDRELDRVSHVAHADKVVLVFGAAYGAHVVVLANR